MPNSMARSKYVFPFYACPFSQYFLKSRTHGDIPMFAAERTHPLDLYVTINNLVLACNNQRKNSVPLKPLESSISSNCTYTLKVNAISYAFFYPKFCFFIQKVTSCFLSS
uniref:Uncharacterized protein n=1 Tax=Micrurus spixii TaxID=129469 RepID=A0A2D4MKI4_9SAUR